MGTGNEREELPEQNKECIAMSDTIVVSIISLAGSVIVAVLSFIANRKGAREASETNAKLLDYRLKQLEAKQDRHNSMIERMYKVEGAVTELQHEVSDLKKVVPKTAS